MKSIPSLVASSTIGVAATGLVFGRPQQATPPRPESNKRKATEFEQGDRIPISRPATSSVLQTPVRNAELSSSPAPTEKSRESPLESMLQSQGEGTFRSSGRGSANRRRGSTPGLESGLEDRKDSMSSRGSWYRRLSNIPTSQSSNSPRSSVGPDWPSVSLSHGSAAPILSSPLDAPPQTAPNKLVKRAYSGKAIDGGVVRSASRSGVPTLRRPATSHQRDATLQQRFREHEALVSSPADVSPRSQDNIIHEYSTNHAKSKYRHYFESRNTRMTKERLSGRAPDGSEESLYAVSKRITLPKGSESSAPILLKAEMILKPVEVYVSFSDFGPSDNMASRDSDRNSNIVLEPETHKRPKRSLSMHFSSPTAWISRTGSLRAAKRGSGSRATGRRHASAPLPSVAARTVSTAGSDIPGPIHEPMVEGNIDQQGSHQSSMLSNRRSSSSPLPALSRLSSFNVDLNRMGFSSSSSGRRTPTSPSPVINSYLVTSRPEAKIHGRNSRPSSNYSIQKPAPNDEAVERMQTNNVSDKENSELVICEEDDTDFQSESVFDSYRSGNTGSSRVRSPALESMFDDSPISTSSRSKVTTIDDLAGKTFYVDDHDKISEEDEGMSTPMKTRRGSADDTFTTPTRQDLGASNAIRSSPPSFSLAASQNFGRLSLEDDDEDEDWTRDDISVAFSNSLSPPSTTNSARIHPAIRVALASASGNSLPSDIRPKSVFDWSEPSTAEKPDAYGQSPRPRTVHGKQAMLDGRGGRAVGRRGPSAFHIRSQSVPVVPQVPADRESNKLQKKFGTWGLGGKGVSEDWDNDFEFEGLEINGNTGGQSSTSSSMVVPKAIKESQASVVGHVGQIREICLLVDDLKRLRGLAKEKSLLYGRQASLWRQADGIIALAAGDEDDAAFSPPRSPPVLHLEQDSDESILDEEMNFVETGDGQSPANFVYAERPARFARAETFHNRRRSVFSPDDDIFGVVESIEEPVLPKHSLSTKSNNSTDVARSVMEDIHQHRVVSDPLPDDFTSEIPGKMPFDTTSLKELVARASNLARILAEIIRKHDAGFKSPNRSPEHNRDDRERDSSPAFTRVFTPDNLATPPPLGRSQSTTSVANGSIDSSPTRGISQRMHMMTVV